MSALTDSEFDQVRELLDIADDWLHRLRTRTGEAAGHCCTPPADVRAVKRNGRVWAAAPDRSAWVSRDERVMALIRDDIPAAIVSTRLLKSFDAADPIAFRVDGFAYGHVAVLGTWYSERLLAGLVALHGPPTHSALSHLPGSMLLWKAHGGVRAALMPVRSGGVDRNLLAELHMGWSS